MFLHARMLVAIDVINQNVHIESEWGSVLSIVHQRQNVYRFFYFL